MEIAFRRRAIADMRDRELVFMPIGIRHGPSDSMTITAAQIA